MTTLADLAASGGLVSDAPVKRTIEYTIGDESYTAEIFVKLLSIGAQERLFNASSSLDEYGKGTTMIAELIRLGENGDERLTVEQADTLHPSLAEAFILAITDVNRLTPRKN